MQSYFAVIHKDADSDFGVSFPDLPGCVTAGRSLDEAREMASEALAFHLAAMLSDREADPTPSSLEVIAASEDARDAIAVVLIAPQTTTAEATA